MTDNGLRAPIEAILMIASEPVAASDLADVLDVSVDAVEEQLRALAAEYLGDGTHEPRGFELREVAGGWRIYSARAYADSVGRFVDGVVRTLLARGLVEETGLTPSGARLYGTTGEFLEKMGLTSLSELVPLAPYLPDADALEELEEEL